MSNRPKVTIWGAGAIGGTIAAELVRQGEGILLVDAVKPHVERMNAEGLFIEKDRDSFTARVRASLPEEVKPPLDVVFLCVKSHHTPHAVGMVKPLLANEGIVVSLQNGLNEEVIAEQIGRDRTLGALVNFSADYIAPGHILYGGEGSLVLGELDGRVSDRVKGLRDFLGKAMAAGMTENLWGLKWSKVCYGSLLVATALVDEPVCDIVFRSASIQRALVKLVCELMEVAEAYGIRIESFDEFLPDRFRKASGGDEESLRLAMEPIAHHYRTQTKGKTGVWRDLAVKKRKTEVDALMGRIVQKGEAKGFPCPMNRKLIQLIHEVEDGKRPMQWENLDELIPIEQGKSRRR